jgi:2-oxoglutarate ferredoxin oxidoreductase subunit alpha
MVHTRQAKIDRIANWIPAAQVEGDPTGELLLVGWGGTYGSIRQASELLRGGGAAVSHLHLRYLNPLQRNVGEILRSFRRVLVVELNLGQLRLLLRGRFLVDAFGLSKVQGQPFRVREIVDAARKLLRGEKLEEVRA